MTYLEKHEANRWNTMTLGQMETRLFKITNVEKLKLFVKFANRNGRRKLAKLAKEKIEFLQGA